MYSSSCRPSDRVLSYWKNFSKLSATWLEDCFTSSPTLWLLSPRRKPVSRERYRSHSTFWATLAGVCRKRSEQPWTGWPERRRSWPRVSFKLPKRREISSPASSRGPKGLEPDFSKGSNTASMMKHLQLKNMVGNVKFSLTLNFHSDFFTFFLLIVVVPTLWSKHVSKERII